MKTYSLNLLAAAVLGISAISAVNAAPATFKSASVIAYDQGGNDPFPTSAPEAGDSGVTVVAYDQGGRDPFPTSAPEAGDSTVQIHAYHEGGSDPFPPSAPEAGVIA